MLYFNITFSSGSCANWATIRVYAPRTHNLFAFWGKWQNYMDPHKHCDVCAEKLRQRRWQHVKPKKKKKRECECTCVLIWLCLSFHLKTPTEIHIKFTLLCSTSTSCTVSYRKIKFRTLKTRARKIILFSVEAYMYRLIFFVQAFLSRLDRRLFSSLFSVRCVVVVFGVTGSAEKMRVASVTY